MNQGSSETHVPGMEVDSAPGIPVARAGLGLGQCQPRVVKPLRLVGLNIRRSEYSVPFVFSPCVILSASPLEQNRILGNTDLGEVAEAAPPTSDGS